MRFKAGLIGAALNNAVANFFFSRPRIDNQGRTSAEPKKEAVLHVLPIERDRSTLIDHCDDVSPEFRVGRNSTCWSDVVHFEGAGRPRPFLFDGAVRMIHGISGRSPNSA